MNTKKKEFNFDNMTPTQIDFVVQNYITKSQLHNKNAMILGMEIGKETGKKKIKTMKAELDQVVKEGKEWTRKASELFESYVSHLEAKLNA